jgi:hypothetical protein
LPEGREVSRAVTQLPPAPLGLNWTGGPPKPVFPDGTDWFKANWVFRQLAEDVSNRYRHDDDVRKSLELAQAIGMLHLKDMDEKLRRNVMRAIKNRCG